MLQRILGIDPGTIRTGYGLLDAEGTHAKFLTCGAIALRSSYPIGKRLWKIHQDLLSIVASWNPDVIAIEEPFMPTAKSDNGEFRTTFRSVMAIGQASGVALMVGAAAGIPTFRYTPTQVKTTVVDYGRGSKAQVQEMVRLILRLEEPPVPSDAADALAVALCHLQQNHVTNLLKAN